MPGDEVHKIYLGNIKGPPGDIVTIANTHRRGAVKISDDGTILVDDEGTISVPIATITSLGVVKPDGTSIRITEDGTISVDTNSVTATADKAGTVKPDGSSITVGDDGVVSVPEASTDSPGIVKPDGKSIVINKDGTISTSPGTPIGPLKFEIRENGHLFLTYDDGT